MAFIQIDNDIFLDEDTIRVIKAEGFAIYCLLLMKQGSNEFVDFSINSIITYTNRGGEVYLHYGKDKRKLPRLNNLRTIRPYLKALESEGLLVLLDNKIDLNKTTSSETVLCKVKTKEKDKDGFIQIDHRLLVNYINKIGHTGWLVYCLLYRYHNKTFGSEYSEGFANPSIEHMSYKLNISNKPLNAYLQLLDSSNLIKIEHVKPTYVKKDAHDKDIFKNYPNNYIVKARLSGNKYFIPSKP